MNAFCDTLSLSPSPLGQEMGHGYGLDHARQEGSDTDYMDPWDVMSVFDSAVMTPNAEIPDYSEEQYYGSEANAGRDWTIAAFKSGGKVVPFTDYVKVRLAGN